MHKQKIILVDMDGVLADFEGAFLKEWRTKFPDHPHIPITERKLFYLHEEYPAELNSDIRSITSKPGFFLNLPEIPGGIEALKGMEKLGFNVFICTSPVNKYENCVLEKYQWVADHFGYNWTRKVIMTKDKTLVYGDYLIDDKPQHTGVREPVWEHILFDAPYNREVEGKRRITWQNWKHI